MSRLIYGCMGLGGGWNHEPVQGKDIAHARAALDAALEIGITRFDHADIYTHGKAEQVFGELFKAEPALRERIVLQTKCGIRFGDAHGPGRYDLSRAYIIAAVEASLARLHTDYIDVLLLHRPDPLMEPDEINEAWHTLYTAGKVRALGVSNMHAGQLRLLTAALDTSLVANQLEMSLARRDWLEAETCFNDAQGAGGLVWADTLAYCQRKQIGLQAWGALAKGWYSGGAAYDAPPVVNNTAQLVRELAHQHQVAPESIVLAWLLRHPAGIAPVIGTSHPERIRACRDAERIQLSREEWYRLYVTARGHALP
ncbi:aldo/keto reductase family oxidoreductase [Massilia sp. TS11]|uniref:aldo/keto reductase n=1 Tax=Massilia sp. TS11 TaxID=2908003 RepID=UPI001ED9F134|nr:aldo/keto reductase [Massilia sp. TS11]MCG2583731.1 aldo/keto reductase [Massilia sp. TS11]